MIALVKRSTLKFFFRNSNGFDDQKSILFIQLAKFQFSFYRKVTHKLHQHRNGLNTHSNALRSLYKPIRGHSLLHLIQKNLISASGAATDKNWASVLHKDSFSFSLSRTFLSLSARIPQELLTTVYKIGKRFSAQLNLCGDMRWDLWQQTNANNTKCSDRFIGWAAHLLMGSIHI